MNNLPAVIEPVQAPDPNAAIAAAAARTGQLADAVDAVEIVDDTTEAQANEMLGAVARARKQTDAERVGFVKPLNDTVKKINEGFRQTLEPLEQAEAALKDKILARITARREAAAEAERARQAEAARLRREQEAERRREEEAARADRERAAREAAAAEAEQRRAERERLARMDARKSELHAEVAAMGDDQLQTITGATSAPEPGSDASITLGLAIDELQARRRAREAAEASAAARQREQDAREAERRAREAAPVTPADQAIAPAAPVGPVRSATATTGTRKMWRVDVTDPRLVPREFMDVSEARLLAHARATGGAPVQGARFYQDETVATRTR